MPEIVTIIGASEKKHRFANMAMKELLKNGYDVRLVNPFKESVEGYKCYKTVTDITENINTVTLYVNPHKLRNYIEDIVQAKPTRVIMNPGTEDDAMAKILNTAGIEVIHACTLVLLSTGQF